MSVNNTNEALSRFEGSSLGGVDDINYDSKREVTKQISTKKKEKKLSIDYKKVEIVIEEIIEKYNLNIEIEEYILLKMEAKINHKEILHNNKQEDSTKIKYQFDIEFFNDCFEYVESKFRIAIDKECIDADEEKLIILGTVFDTIELTMFETGFYKPKLVTFHYLMKCAEKIAKDIISNNNVSKIRGYIIPIEVFKFELLNIIGNDTDLTKFLVTIKSLVDNTLVKYNNKTKIGQFYYNVMMTTPSQIVEKIIRALIFTSLKNKNPVTLRAIFSTYMTLIHTNIYTHYSTKLTTIKTGHFKGLDDLFDKSFLEDSYSSSQNTYQHSISEMMKVFLIKNKRYFKDNYELIDDDFVNNFFDINYFDLIYSYKEDMNILDYTFFYNKFLKLTKNSFRSQSFYYKLNSNYINSKNTKEMKTYINNKVNEELFQDLFEIFQDKDTVFEVTEFLTLSLFERVNPKNMLDSNFDRLHVSFDNYLNYIIQIIKNMKKLL